MRNLFILGSVSEVGILEGRSHGSDALLVVSFWSESRSVAVSAVQ